MNNWRMAWEFLTRALAESEGVDEERSWFWYNGRKYLAYLIYDTAKGGCGYSLKFFDPVACQEILTCKKKYQE